MLRQLTRPGGGSIARNASSSLARSCALLCRLRCPGMAIGASTGWAVSLLTKAAQPELLKNAFLGGFDTWLDTLAAH